MTVLCAPEAKSVTIVVSTAVELAYTVRLKFSELVSIVAHRDVDRDSVSLSD